MTAHALKTPILEDIPQDEAVRSLIGPLSDWLPAKRAWIDCPDCLEHDDGRECDQCGNKGWLWADHGGAL